MWERKQQQSTPVDLQTFPIVTLSCGNGNFLKVHQVQVQIINFNQLSETSTLVKIEAILSFQKFGTIDFSNFMQGLVDNEKFKITRIDLTKDKESNLLNGEMTLLHLGRNLNNINN